jgi:geranylgeranyl reductase family protein
VSAVAREGSSPTYDVAVVGAGPAGATAALYLARGGKKVALIERETLPRYKTCGGGVVGRAFKCLPSDVKIPVEHECFIAEANFLESKMSFRVERKVPIVSMTMRADLDKALADAAVASGAELIAPCTLIDLKQDAGGVELETSRGRIRAAWVIGADGVLSTVARKAGWKHAPKTIPALEAEVRVSKEVHARFAGVARFDFEAMEAGYGWVFPKREHLSCGILTMERGVGGLHEALDRYLARVGVTDLISKELHGYVIPVRPRRGGLVRGRVMLVGDAAGFADALTGEGISLAMISGQLAADALAEHSPERAGRAYSDRTRRELLGELRVARGLAWVTYRRREITGALFRARGATLAERVADIFLGVRTYRSLVSKPSSYFSLLRARVPRVSSGT